MADASWTPLWTTSLGHMKPIEIVALLLALSIALNIAFTAGLVVYRAERDLPRAILTGASAAATTLVLYLTAVTAYG
ncbi:Uncharacterised protein [Mycobacterium tuberculosis]|nr:Uncharacterised protein [Mycobacterium tuberculosis]